VLAGVEVDVLKVPHHGSRHQDLDFLLGLRARLALVSVGADNDYGHPAPDLLAALTASGAQVRRTDLDGDVLVTAEVGADDGALGVRARG
jgi:competence protein ComEC